MQVIIKNHDQASDKTALDMLDVDMDMMRALIARSCTTALSRKGLQSRTVKGIMTLLINETLGVLKRKGRPIPPPSRDVYEYAGACIAELALMEMDKTWTVDATNGTVHDIAAT